MRSNTFFPSRSSMPSSARRMQFLRAAAGLVFLAAGVLPQLHAQGANVLSVGEIPTLHVHRGQAAEQKLTLELRPGFHVNSNKPNDEFLIPLKLTWAPSAGIEPGAVEYPAPKLEHSSFSDKPLSVFDGTFQIITPV